MTEKIFGGMEGGGTKFVCAVGADPEHILDEEQFATSTPGETIGRAVEFFKRHEETGLAGIGLAPFGPLDLDPRSPTYGHTMATPKPSWTGADVLGEFRRAFRLPLAFDLDVNAAAFGEYTWVPANRGLDVLVYFTIGTGIGAGVVVDGRIVHGLTHPEAGHVRLPHDWQLDPYPGICPFHGDCFEGLATGPAMQARWGQPAENLPDDHPAWDLEASYIALAMNNVILTLSPRRIVLGGGVMQHAALFPLIRGKVQKILNNYISSPVIREQIDELIIPAELGRRSGVLGAMAMVRPVEMRA